MKLAVIGHPINHSKSPIIHGRWLENAQIDGTYEAIDIAPDNLEKEIARMVDEGYQGFNVTLPHKENIMKLCDVVDDTAKHIGAVNTVVINNGKLSGYNTDAYGFIQNIKSNAPKYDFTNKAALVLGAGGAARAVLRGLLEAGMSRIILTNRTIEKAEALKQMSPDQIDVVEWGNYKNNLKDIDLLVNTTSLGMVGKTPLDIDLSSVNKNALVTDIVYTPLETDLLKQAKDNGNEIVTGIGMLLYQAQKSFEIWTGSLPAVDQNLIDEVLA